jgi:hypothetical protein
VAEDTIEFGDLTKKIQQSTFGAHFVEVGVDIRSRWTRCLTPCQPLPECWSLFEGLSQLLLIL